MSATKIIDAERDRVSARDPGGWARRSAGPDRRWDLLAVVLPTALAVGLCLYDLTTRSLWLDESATVAIATQHGAAFGTALAHDGGNMLAYYALMHVLIGWFGAGAFVIRFPSVVFAGVTVAATGALALRLFGRRAGALAGTLTAVSLSLVYWGQDARGYAAMVGLIAASFLALVALLEPEAGWRPWAAYVVLMTLAVYAGLEAVLVIPAQLLVLGWRRERWRALVSAVVAVAVCCLPLAVLAANRGSGQLFWVPPPSFRILRQIVEALTSAALQPDFRTATTSALTVFTLALLVAGAGTVLVTATRERRATIWAPALVLSWLLVPAVLAVIESTVGQSIFQARYLLVSLPAVSLLLAWTMTRPRLPWPAILVTLAALITLRALQLAPAYGVSSENWRGLTAYVVGHRQPRDCIAFYPLDNRQAFRYYLGSPAAAPRPLLPAIPWPEVRPLVEDYGSLSSQAVANLPALCERVWLIASHEGRVGGPPTSRANFRRFSALTSNLHRLYPRTWSATFGAQGVVTLTLYRR